MVQSRRVFSFPKSVVRGFVVRRRCFFAPVLQPGLIYLQVVFLLRIHVTYNKLNSFFPADFLHVIHIECRTLDACLKASDVEVCVEEIEYLACLFVFEFHPQRGTDTDGTPTQRTLLRCLTQPETALIQFCEAVFAIHSVFGVAATVEDFVIFRQIFYGVELLYFFHFLKAYDVGLLGVNHIDGGKLAVVPMLQSRVRLFHQSVADVVTHNFQFGVPFLGTCATDSK